MDTSFGASATGEIKLREAEERAGGGWDSAELVDVDGDVTLCVMRDEGDDHTSIDVSAWHIPNPTTGRAFHSVLRANLDRPQLARLHAYLGFLLAAG